MTISCTACRSTGILGYISIADPKKPARSELSVFHLVSANMRRRRDVTNLFGKSSMHLADNLSARTSGVGRNHNGKHSQKSRMRSARVLYLLYSSLAKRLQMLHHTVELWYVIIHLLSLVSRPDPFRKKSRRGNGLCDWFISKLSCL